MAAEWPEDWTPATLGECTDQLAGFAFKSKLFVEESEGVRLLRGDNIAPGSLRWNGAKAYPPELLDGLGHYALREGDVVVAMDRPWIDAGLKVARVGPDAVPSMLVQRVTRLRGNAHVDTAFVWACVRSATFAAHLRSETTGTAVPHISGKQIASFPMFLPSLSEQRAIASVLGALDDKIESNRRLVQLQREARRLCFKHQVREMDSRKSLDEVAAHLKGTIQPAGSPDEEFEQFSIPAFDAGEDPDVCSGASMASGKTPLPDEPVMLLSKLNPRIPRIWHSVGSGNRRAVCSPEFVVLAPRSEISHAWLESCLRYDDGFYGEVLSGVTGTTGSRQRVKPSDVLAATVPAPEPEVLAEWTAFATPMIAREAALDRERRVLVSIRDALLPKLVSGRIRVPVSTDSAEALGAALATGNADAA